MYAYDSTLTSRAPTVVEINCNLNTNCDEVSTWMKENRQCLNTDKTHFMVAGTKQRPN